MEVTESSPNASPRSVHSRTGTPVRFTNHSRSRVKVFWLDYQGSQVLYSTLEPSNGFYDVNTYVTHPWIAVDEQTNQPMLLNFEKIYHPLAPEYREMHDGDMMEIVRREVVITSAVPYTLQEYCKDLVKKNVLPQNANQLPLPQKVVREIWNDH